MSASTARGGGGRPLTPSIRRAVNSSGSGQRLAGRPVERHGEGEQAQAPAPTGQQAGFNGLLAEAIA